MLIPYPVLKKKYGIESKGVFHIGANDAEHEAAWYYENGVEKTLWIEALPDAFERLNKTLEIYPNVITLNKCISNNDFQNRKFNVASNKGESSSLLEFGSHKINHPDVVFNGSINVTTIRVDTLLNTKGINIKDYDFLNIDVQGVEGLVLESMGDMLRGFKHLYIEVNRGEDVYIGCSKFEEICDYVSEYGFELKEVKWTGADWGDAYFEKKKNMNSVFRRNNLRYIQKEGVVNVPQKFMAAMPFHYPPDNETVFEKWFYDTYNKPTERLYLPIQWTGFLVSHSFGNDLNAISELQKFVDGLDRSKKYYTIHQFDLGCMVDFKDLDILVFGMAGGRIDYCLPLLCMTHKFEFNKPKTLIANFIGRNTHPIRQKMIDILSHEQGVYISEAKHDLSAYCSIIASSKFTLCPRGYSANSFRILEALQYGSIPVIITDQLLQPHGIDPREYAIVIMEDELDKLSNISEWLDESDIQALSKKGEQYFESHFTYSACKKHILEQLNK